MAFRVRKPNDASESQFLFLSDMDDLTAHRSVVNVRGDCVHKSNFQVLLVGLGLATLLQNIKL